MFSLWYGKENSDIMVTWYISDINTPTVVKHKLMNMDLQSWINGVNDQ